MAQGKGWRVTALAPGLRKPLPISPKRVIRGAGMTEENLECSGSTCYASHRWVRFSCRPKKRLIRWRGLDVFYFRGPSSSPPHCPAVFVICGCSSISPVVRAKYSKANSVTYGKREWLSFFASCAEHWWHLLGSPALDLVGVPTFPSSGSQAKFGCTQVEVPSSLRLASFFLGSSLLFPCKRRERFAPRSSVMVFDGSCILPPQGHVVGSPVPAKISELTIVVENNYRTYSQSISS